jgi:uncharacterized protein YjlB
MYVGVGVDFEVSPPPNYFRLNVMGEIVKAQGFDDDNLYALPFYHYHCTAHLLICVLVCHTDISNMKCIGGMIGYGHIMIIFTVTML